MKTHDNTLYVTTQGAYLGCEGTNIRVRVEGETKLRLPIHTVGGIVCFGKISCSPFLMGMCGQNKVGLSFCTTTGRFLARVNGPQSGNVLLRRAQHANTSTPHIAADVARIIVTAKIANSRTVIQRALRDYSDRIDCDLLRRATNRMASLVEELEKPMTLDRVRGIEGEAAAIYFSIFDHLIVQQKKAFFMKERSRRPPRDNTNALLSYLYTILANDIVSACESVGLDPQMGFLHADRPGRSSLALDMMEEFRPVIADRLALSLINRQQINSKGFKQRESGAVMMNDETRKTVLVAYQKRKAEEILHPFLKEKMTLGLLYHVQARLMARWLRGDLDAYPAFFWR